VTIVVTSSASTTHRTRLTATTIVRRSSRSDSAPANNPNTSGGNHCTVAPSATSTAESVCDAISNGPAASAIPSPRLEIQDEASNHRNPPPSRGGAMTSTRRLTGRR
jgi:hypothetical protein